MVTLSNGMAAFIILQRTLELCLAASNRRWMLKRGATESGAGHYPLFFLLHAGWLAGWYLEAGWRGPGLVPAGYFWLALFFAAQGLRYWCIVSLGRYWNTRILTLPGTIPLCRGPYLFMRHPNYLAVSVELAAVPLIFGAWLTALTATVLNALLLILVRIPAEERALAAAAARE